MAAYGQTESYDEIPTWELENLRAAARERAELRRGLELIVKEGDTWSRLWAAEVLAETGNGG